MKKIIYLVTGLFILTSLFSCKLEDDTVVNMDSSFPIVTINAINRISKNGEISGTWNDSLKNPKMTIEFIKDGKSYPGVVRVLNKSSTSGSWSCTLPTEVDEGDWLVTIQIKNKNNITVKEDETITVIGSSNTPFFQPNTTINNTYY